MSAVTGYKHIILDDSGRPLIEGTRTKVLEVVLDHYTHGWSPEEIQWQHSHLTLSQIHAAFVYYYDHQEQLDRTAQQQLELSERGKATSQATAMVQERLRVLGRK